MRSRLFVITGLAVAALAATSSLNAAVAGGPNGPGKVGPSPTTTAPPKGPDKYAPSPTTTQPPKGPGDIAPAPEDDGPDGPNGPGDLAPAPKSPKPPVEPGPDTTGNGSGNLPGDPTDGNDAPGHASSADTSSAGGPSAEDGTHVVPLSSDASESAATPPSAHRNPMWAWALAALAFLVALFIAGLVIPSRRIQDADAEQR